jgi:hypothetical protein
MMTTLLSHTLPNLPFEPAIHRFQSTQNMKPINFKLLQANSHNTRKQTDRPRKIQQLQDLRVNLIPAGNFLDKRLLKIEHALQTLNYRPLHLLQTFKSLLNLPQQIKIVPVTALFGLN